KERRVLSLILRPYKGAPQLQRRADLVKDASMIAEQGAGVEPAHSPFGKNLGSIAGAIAAQKLPLGAMPQQEMPVVAVVAVEVAPLAGAFARRAKRDFTHPPHFLQQARRFIPFHQIDSQISAFR